MKSMSCGALTFDGGRGKFQGDGGCRWRDYWLRIFDEDTYMQLFEIVVDCRVVEVDLTKGAVIDCLTHQGLAVDIADQLGRLDVGETIDIGYFVIRCTS